MQDGASTITLVDGRRLHVFGQSNRILKSIDHGNEVELVPAYSDCEVLFSSLLWLTSNRLLMVYGVNRSLTDCRYFGQFLDEEGCLDGAVVPIMLDDGYRLVSENRLIQLNSGRLLLPCMLFDGSSGTLKPCSIVLIYYSDDEGENWEVSPQLIMGPLLSELGLQAPLLVQNKEGRVRLDAISDNGSQFHCLSYDEGLTWSTISETKESI